MKIINSAVVLTSALLISLPALACDEDMSSHSNKSEVQENHENSNEKVKQTFIKANTFFKVEGMKCSKCVNKVTQAIKNVDGVIAVEVNLDTGNAGVILMSQDNKDKIVKAVSEAGYKATLTEK